MKDTASIRWLDARPPSVSGFSPIPAEWFDPRLIRGLVQERMASLLPAPQDETDLVSHAMRSFALAPGKRLRPVLTVMSAAELGQGHHAVLDVACAVEMVHGASLILDDLPCMDDAALRRGLPTVHRRYGEDTAILASVALLSRAFQVVAEVEGLPPMIRADLVGVLAASVGSQGLVGGQFKDLRGTLAQRLVDEVEQTNALKTGALFGAALEMSAILGCSSDETRAKLRAAAVELGHAFQLLDDLRDTADSSATGKDEGKDEGKGTLVALLGAAEVRRRLDDHVAAARSLLADVHGPYGRLNAYVHELFGGS